ncbi:response regulator [Oceanicoccus sagamiensis]|uniref:Two-component system response regulator BaeR n=1 Tax=Oceanicoccus sagamiensis TaxID=716816 RepID=A0A1X9N8L0_9GAMM|nr:response regulator [Oceanicoccus sagamiensis]ARN72772.1 two-component system response regulator BaeR [Oceanicoccus sagamiensis]
MSEASILIVEDELKIASLLEDYFTQSGYDCHCIDHGDKVISRVKNQPPDIILLDIMLPGKDGITLCKEIRTFSDLPIIMVTAKVDEIDRLLGLELGADDYICKPFSPREVVARTKAVLRRSLLGKSPTVANSPDNFSLDEARQQVVFQQQQIELTTVEYQLLNLLSSDPGRIFSRNQLMDAMYSDHRIVSDRTIDSHIKKIRKKLHSFFPDTEFIHSIYGAGYKFDIDTVP